MNMSGLDWAVVAGVMGFFVAIMLIANRFTRSVSDYLVAGRSAGRYMLTVSSGTEWIGAINIVAMFEVYYRSGLNGMWWVMFSMPFIVYLQISGFGMYRFRETRAMTIGQYLEVRYSRNVRTLASAVAWLAGMVNFAFFPLIGAKLFVSLIGLPETFHVGAIVLPVFPFVTAVVVAVPLLFVVFGGHITVLLSDFIQGLFMNVAALALVLTVLLTMFHWNEIVYVLKQAPAEASMLNPLHTSETKDFSAWYFIIGIATAFYSVMSQVPSQGFQGSAKNAHELRMGNLLGQMRWQGLLVFFMVFVLVAYMFMNHPAYAETAGKIQHSLGAAGINPDPKSAQHIQMLVPAALPFMLPAGMIGLFCAIMFAALISSSNGFLHAWGSVLLQDLILPFRKKPLETRHHILALRLSICAVALIAFVLSLTLNPAESILMFLARFNAIWLGPAGAVILGGLYWKRGTALSAILTFAIGCSLSLAFIICADRWPQWTGREFPINGQWSYLLCIISSIAVYVVASLASKQPDHNMEKLLHRGPYAIEDDQRHVHENVTWWQRLFGITRQFNREDRITAYLVVGYFLLSLAVFVIGMTYGKLMKPDDDAWAKFWHVYLYVQVLLLVGSTSFLGAGGIRDMLRLFRQLHSNSRDYDDTGEVAHEDHSSQAVEVIADAPSPTGK
jgi:solute:Na+ symporter, SSS family